MNFIRELGIEECNPATSRPIARTDTASVEDHEKPTPSARAAFAHGRGALHRYRFGQPTAGFLTCRDCGIPAETALAGIKKPLGVGGASSS